MERRAVKRRAVGQQAAEDNLNVPDVYKSKWALVDHYIADKYAPITSPSPMVGWSSFRAHGRNRTTSDERALTVYVRALRLAMN